MPSYTDTPPVGAAVDTTPLLRARRRASFLRRPPSFHGAASFLRRASSRSGALREPSVRVREAAAEQIEERQSDWAYSKPIVILDLVWNIAFVIVSISVLITSRVETPPMPLRLWIVGYSLQCVLHVVCVCAEYKKRYSQGDLEGSEIGPFVCSRNYSNSSSGSDDVYSGGYFSYNHQIDDESSIARHLEFANAMFSFIWWVIGLYWVSAGGHSLTSESPQLYWLCITFLVFDVFFMLICLAVACIIGLAVCCCLPCIITILYAVADQEGATKEDIKRLPKYRFRKFCDFEKQSGEIRGSFGGVMTECDSDSPAELVLPLDNAECCICLSAYDDRTELRELPCGHHFHAACIEKWLHVNATCPLCKFNILKNGNKSGTEEV